MADKRNLEDDDATTGVTDEQVRGVADEDDEFEDSEDADDVEEDEEGSTF